METFPAETTIAGRNKDDGSWVHITDCTYRRRIAARRKCPYVVWLVQIQNKVDAGLI